MSKRRQLSQYLAYHRRRQGLTQGQMAQLVGVYDDSVVSRFETGLQTPSLEVAFAYQAVFHLPLTEIFAGMWEKVERKTERRARKVADELLKPK